MQILELTDGYLIRLEKDEKLHESLLRFAAEKNIQSASYIGLGALKNTELGFYHLDRKEYDRRVFEHEAELINLTGNIGWFDGKHAIHTHLTLGDEEFRAHGGHCFEAKVAVTVEIHMRVFPQKAERQFEPDVGLNLFQLCRL